MTQANGGHRLRSRRGFHKPSDPAMTTLYLRETETRGESPHDR